MTNTFGFFATSMSEDCVIDGDALARELNYYTWCDDSIEWKYRNECLSNDFKIYPAIIGKARKKGIQNPTLQLLNITALKFLDELGNSCWIPFEDVDEEYWSYASDERFEDIPLSILSENISRHIKSGWFEISYNSSGKKKAVESGRLKVYSDGKAECHLIISDGCFVLHRDDNFNPISYETIRNDVFSTSQKL